MNSILNICVLLGLVVIATASDIELIQYSDLRLRNAAVSETSLFRTWVLQGKPEVTITFEQKQAYGSDGCNRYSSPVTIKEKSLKFGAVMATRAACEQLKGSDAAFRRTLISVESYRITEKGLLELLGESGQVLLTFHR